MCPLHALGTANHLAPPASTAARAPPLMCRRAKRRVGGKHDDDLYIKAAQSARRYYKAPIKTGGALRYFLLCAPRPALLAAAPPEPSSRPSASGLPDFCHRGGRYDVAVVAIISLSTIALLRKAHYGPNNFIFWTSWCRASTLLSPSARFHPLPLFLPSPLHPLYHLHPGPWPHFRYYAKMLYSVSASPFLIFAVPVVGARRLRENKGPDLGAALRPLSPPSSSTPRPLLGLASQTLPYLGLRRAAVRLRPSAAWRAHDRLRQGRPSLPQAHSQADQRQVRRGHGDGQPYRRLRPRRVTWQSLTCYQKVLGLQWLQEARGRCRGSRQGEAKATALPPTHGLQRCHIVTLQEDEALLLGC